MSYKLPSTHIYQLLENSGGAARVTPDLSAIIVGPLFNLVGVDIDKEKARSAEFSAWPRHSVKPDPEPEPEPEVIPFAINPVHYVDFGNNGIGFTITGTSPDEIGTDFAIGVDVIDSNGEVSPLTPNINMFGSLTRNPVTKVWTFVGNSRNLAMLNLYGPFDKTFTVRINCVNATVAPISAYVTRVLAPMTTIVEPELDLTMPVGMTVSDPTWFYHYENVTRGAEIS